MADLHSRLVESLTARLERARAATPGPWLHVDFAEPSGQSLTASGEQSTFMGCGSVITLGENVMGGDVAAPSGDLYPRSGYSPKEDMAYIAANAPDVEIRRVEATLRLVQAYETALVALKAAEGTVLAGAARLKVATLADVLRDIAAGEGIEP